MREIGRREQRQRVDLVVAGADEHVGDACGGRAGAALRPPIFAGFDGTVRGDVVEADPAGHFLDEVDLALEIGAERRDATPSSPCISMPSGAR